MMAHTQDAPPETGPPEVAGGAGGDAPQLASVRVTYDLRLLEPFLALADELHFGRAAQRLSFAQPALSQQIRRLELQLGLSLFLRDSRSVELTSAGAAFRDHAAVSVAAAADAAQAAAAADAAATGQLSVSVGSEALAYTHDLLRGFATSERRLQLKVILQFGADSIDALDRHIVDAAILWSDDRPPAGFEGSSTLLAAPGLGVSVRESHPLAEVEEVTIDQVAGQRLVMFPRSILPVMYDSVLARLGGGENFDGVHEVSPIGLGVANDMAAALDDVSVAPSSTWTAQHHGQRGILFKPITPSVPCTLWLVWLGSATAPVNALSSFAYRGASSCAHDARSVPSLQRGEFARDGG